MGLFLFVSGPFTRLALNATCNILDLALHLILIHDYPPGSAFGLQKGFYSLSFLTSRPAEPSNSGYRISALDQADQNCDHRQEEENMNKSA
jgi:hypothetical protein